MSLVQVMDRCVRQLALLTGRTVAGVVGAEETDGKWCVEVELVERKAVPDSMDLLGLYRVTADGSGNVLGFERVSLRYRGKPGEADDSAASC